MFILFLFRATLFLKSIPSLEMNSSTFDAMPLSIICLVLQAKDL